MSDELKIQPDPTSDCGVSCPLVFEKSIFCIVATLAPSILIGSSSFLEETRSTLCPVTVLVDSQVSDRCPWATCYHLFCYEEPYW